MPNQKKEQPFPVSQLGFVWENMKGKRPVFVLSMLGTAVYNGLQIVVPFFTGKLVDTFLTGPNAAENLVTQRPLFWQLVIAMIVLTIIRVAVVYIDCMGFEVASQHVYVGIQKKLYDKIQRQDMTFYAKYRTGDLMTRMTGDLDAVRHMVAWVVRMLLQCITLFGTAAIYFFVMDWRLAVCLLSLTPILFFVVYKFRLKIAPMHTLLREKFAGMNTDAQENISGNRVVKAFAREDYEIQKFDKTNTAYADTNKATQMTWLRFYPAVEGCANLMPVLLLVVGGLRLISGGLTMGEYVAFSGLIWAVCAPMRDLGGILNEFQRFSAAVHKIMEIWYAKPGICDSETAMDHPDHFKGKVEFKNVSFIYDDGTVPVLRDISFTANPGETVAIMGETGCGKTTLINLIPRFFDPTNGTILLDDIDISTLKL